MTRMRQYARNAGALVGQSTIQRVCGMFTTVVLSRVLGAGAFGAYSAVANTASSAYGMVRLGVDASIHVHSADAHETESARSEKGKMFAAGLAILGVSGAAGAVFCFTFDSWLARSVYGHPELSHWLPVAGVLVFVQCLSQFCYATLAGLHRFLDYARQMVLSALMGALFLSVGCICFGLRGALLSLVVVQGITLLLLAVASQRALTTEGMRLDFSSLWLWTKRHFKFGFPFYAAGLVSVPVGYYLQGILSQNVGLSALAEMRVVASVLALITFVPTACAAAMISMLVRSSAENPRVFVADLWVNLKYVWLFAAVVGQVVFILMPVIIGLLFGSTYLGAIRPASIALLTAINGCVVGVIGNALFSRKRVGLIFIQTALQMAIFASLASVLIPRLGLEGYFAAELGGSIAALLFLWAASAGWRSRNALAPAWMLPATTFSILNGALVLFLATRPNTIERSMVGLLALLVLVSLSYRVILDEVERTEIVALVGKFLA